MMLFFSFSTYINCVCAVLAGWRTPNIRVMDITGTKELGTRILPDLGHDFFYVLEGWFGKDNVQSLDPDFFITIAVQLWLFFTVAHPKRLQIFRRFFAVYGYILMHRAVCVIITSLPDSHPRCTAQFGSEKGAYKTTPMFPKAFSRGLKLMMHPSQVVTCGDMIFSGHTTMTMLTLLTFYQYANLEECNTPLTRMLPKWTLPLFRFVQYTIGSIAIFAIIGTRLHYTLDVIIAVYISLHAWSSYHALALAVRQNESITALPKFLQNFFIWLEHEEIQNADHEAYMHTTRLSTLGLNLGDVIGGNTHSDSDSDDSTQEDHHAKED